MKYKLKKCVDRIKGLWHGGFFHILMGGSLTKIIAFMSSIFIVRLLSKDEYAFLAYADNIYAYILLICGLGTSSAILKYCISDDTNMNQAYFRYAIKFGTIAQCVITIVLIIAVYFIEISFPESKKYIYLLAFYPFLYFWIGAIQSYMRSLFKNKEFAYSGIIQSLIVLCLSVAFVLLWGVYGIILARYIALIAVVIYGLRVIWKEVNKKISGDSVKLTRNDKKTFLLFGGYLLFANVFSMIMPINEGFLVNNILETTHITAEYKVASLIPSQLPFFSTAIVTYYFPLFARIKEKNEIWKKMKKVGILTVVLISTITLIGIVVSPLIIKIFYGEQYNNVFILMTLLWIINAINAGFRMLPMNILPAIGYAKFNVIVAAVSCIIHFVFDYYLIQKFGINGAVFASGFVYCLSGIAYWAYLRYKICS